VSNDECSNMYVPAVLCELLAAWHTTRGTHSSLFTLWFIFYSHRTTQRSKKYATAVLFLHTSSTKLICWELSIHYVLFICPIAIANSMGQIIKSVCVCVCQSMCVSICGNSHGCISWSIFTKIGADVVTYEPPKVKTSSFGVISHHPSPILPLKTPF